MPGSSVSSPAYDLRFLAQGDMSELIRSKDRSSTPLGPISGWPQSLRTTVSLCLASNFPINILWGRNHIQIYNDGYRSLCAAKHPQSLAEDYRKSWDTAWESLVEGAGMGSPLPLSKSKPSGANSPPNLPKERQYVPVHLAEELLRLE